MELYLMQHGLALSKEEDPNRPLSGEGARELETSANALQKMDVDIMNVVCSSKQRALQTAQIVAQANGVSEENIVQSDDVKADADPEKSIRFLSSLQNSGNIFLAGHMPSVAKIASLLLAGDAEKISVHFENAGVCRIDLETFEKDAGTLYWNMTPRELARIAE